MREILHPKLQLQLKSDGIYKSNKLLTKSPLINKFNHNDLPNNDTILDHINNRLNDKFWKQLADTLTILVYDPDLGQMEEENMKFQYDNIVRYCKQLLVLFGRDLKNHLELVIVSDTGHIRLNFRNSQIISNLLSIGNKYKNLFQEIDKFVYSEEDIIQLINQRVGPKRIDQSFLNLQSPFVVKENKKVIKIVRQISSLGFFYYLCEEPNFVTYYGELNDKNQKHGRGIEFQTVWVDNNPQFSILQGRFHCDMKEGEFMRYSGRSKTPLQLELWEKNNRISVIEEYFPDGSVRPKVIEEPPAPIQAPKRRIKIMDVDGNQLNNEPAKSYKVQKSEIKYNQQFSKNDENILNSNSWLNSSLIDGMIMYWQKQNYENYITSEDPLSFNRVFVIDSTYFTSALMDYKLATQLQSLLYEYRGISIFDVYKTVALVINSNNTHWLSTLIRRTQIDNKYEIQFEIMDSQKGSKEGQVKKCSKLFSMLKHHLKLDNYCFNETNITVADVLQQNDGYSCGDHTCYFIQQIFEGKDYRDKDRNKVSKIRKLMYNILFQ